VTSKDSASGGAALRQGKAYAATSANALPVNRLPVKRKRLVIIVHVSHSTGRSHYPHRSNGSKTKGGDRYPERHDKLT
jgi:hypothetical protein